MGSRRKKATPPLPTADVEWAAELALSHLAIGLLDLTRKNYRGAAVAARNAEKYLNNAAEMYEAQEQEGRDRRATQRRGTSPGGGT